MATEVQILPALCEGCGAVLTQTVAVVAPRYGTYRFATADGDTHCKPADTKRYGEVVPGEHWPAEPKFVCIHADGTVGTW